MSGQSTVRFPKMNGGIRDSRPVVGGSKLSEASARDSAEDSKSIRPGRPVRRIVRAVLHELGLQQRRD